MLSLDTQPLFQTFFFGEGERDRMLLRWKGEVSVTVAFNSMEDGVFFLSHSPPTSNPYTPPPPFLPSFGYLGFLIGLGIHIILV